MSLTAAVLCGMSNISAQESEPVLLQVHYEFYHLHDTLQPDHPNREEVVLYVGRQSLLYGSYEGQRIEQNIKKQMDDPSFDGDLVIKSSARPSEEFLFIRPRNEEIKVVYPFNSVNYLLESSYPHIDWIIESETRNIGGYQAQKAVGEFGGRRYTAWFTVELPFQGGPWKLQGLPGLVLEATDEAGEVKFTYGGMGTQNLTDHRIGIPDNAIPTDRRALDRLKEAFQKNPQAITSARSKAAAPSGNILEYL